MKSLKEISWQVDEPTYREDSALSYSTLAKYERTGFNGLKNLFDRIETPSLTFGSAVDAIITGSTEEFDAHFMVADFPPVKDSILTVVKRLFERYSELYTTLTDIPNDTIIEVAAESAFQNNWRPETRAKVIKEEGSEYYKLLYLSKDKTILDTNTYQDVCNAVQALKTSPATRWYFQEDNPFDGIERLYQLKFKATLDGVDYRIMMDELVIDHKNKEIYPIDLKTSSHFEHEFPLSFRDWLYCIQARLYYRVLKDNLDKDSYFKDFKVHDYRFIVVNKKSLIPLVWKFEDTKTEGELVYGKNNQLVFRDPFVIGKELKEYLNYEYNVPIGVEIEEPNSITEYLNKI